MGMKVRGNITRSRQLRSNMTDAERKLWQMMRMRQLKGFRFRRQFPIGAYIADFVCLEARLVVEVDGGQHNTEQLEYDSVRDRWLQSQNFGVLRFWNNDVLNNIDGVVERILEALKKQSPSFQPSPLSSWVVAEGVKGEGAKA